MILIPNDVVFDVELSDNDVMIYAFLKVLTYSDNYDSCLFSVAEVVDQIYGESNSHSQSSMVSKSLEHLMKAGYVLTTRKSQSSWHIFMSGYNMVPDESYTLFNPVYFRKIVDAQIRNKANVLRYYMMLMSTVYKKSKVGICDQMWFAKKLDVAPDTISRYTETLEELEVIAVYRAADFYTSNTYGSYENREYVESEGRKRARGRQAKSNANEKRRGVTLFQNFLNGKEYPLNILKEILATMEKRNIEIYELGQSARAVPYDLQPLIDKIKREEYNNNNASAEE